MIKFFNHADIDEKKWNCLLQKSGRETFFAQYQTLTLANSDWGALIEGDYKAVLPLSNRKKWGISYIYTPSFFSRGGIFAEYPLNKSKIALFLQNIPSKFKRIDLIMNETNSDTDCPHLSYFQLPLNQEYDELHKHFSTNCKRNLKTAEKENLIYLSGGNITDIIALFKTNRGTDKHIHLKEADYNLLGKLATYADELGFLDIVSVKNATGNLLAGALMLKDFGTTRFWFSGRDEKYSDTRAMFFLLDNYIRSHSSTKSIFDFNGSTNENIARFYKGFGASEYALPYVQISNSPFIELATKLIKTKR